MEKLLSDTKIQENSSLQSKIAGFFISVRPDFFIMKLQT